jgi:Kef-type K+ transport system membrane component KefB
MELELSSFLQFALELIIILTAAKIGGLLSIKLGQPSVLGELLAGIILGPSLFNITAFPFVTDPEMLNEFIRELGEIGVLFLMFLTGLELHLSDLTRNTRSAVLIAVMGMMLSLGLGSLVGITSGFTGLQPLFIGLALAATSISITAQTLMELNNLRGKVGLGLLGAAVVDDILVLLIYSILLAVASGSNGWGSIAGLILQIGMFFVITIGFGLKLLPTVTQWVSKRRISQGLVTFAIIILLIFSFLAQSLGHLAAILGAFLAGIMFSRTEEKGIIETGMKILTYSLFAPIFFIGIGLQVDLHQIGETGPWLLLGLILAAVVGKFLGAGMGARFSKFSWQESIQIGVGMIPQGEVSLITAAMGLKLGLLDTSVFTGIVITILVTAIITPPLLRLAFTIKPASIRLDIPK